MARQIVRVLSRDFNVASIFIGIQRTRLLSTDWSALQSRGTEAAICCSWLNERMALIIGFIESIIDVAEGKLVILRSTASSLLANWPKVYIWIPKSGGMGGVLNGEFQ